MTAARRWPLWSALVMTTGCNVPTQVNVDIDASTSFAQGDLAVCADPPPAGPATNPADGCAGAAATLRFSGFARSDAPEHLHVRFVFDRTTPSARVRVATSNGWADLGVSGMRGMLLRIQMCVIEGRPRLDCELHGVLDRGGTLCTRP